MTFNFCRTLLWEMDARLAPAWRQIPRPSPLLIFTFHSLFESANEVGKGMLDPQQGITRCMFRDFAADFHHHGYRFVSPGEIAAGLDPSCPCLMITFDDGYANNQRALPVLEEFAAPAVFCVSANHVSTGKPFWWDVLYREARKRAWPEQKLERRRSAWKRLRTADAEAQLAAEFGTPAFRTVCYLDRPFTPGELREFAHHPLVHIGNHTWDHAILTNYSTHEMAEQIQRAQKSLGELTGRVPLVIAYPNGNVSMKIERAAREAGLHLGLTVRPGKNRIPGALRSEPSLRLRRHTLRGDRGIAEQCAIARSPVSLQAALHAIRSAVTV
ncbi:MAG: polysaccharide deacetylase family protein [Terriglobales bacterium]